MPSQGMHKPLCEARRGNMYYILQSVCSITVLWSHCQTARIAYPAIVASKFSCQVVRRTCEGTCSSSSTQAVMPVPEVRQLRQYSIMAVLGKNGTSPRLAVPEVICSMLGTHPEIWLCWDHTMGCCLTLLCLVPTYS